MEQHVLDLVAGHKWIALAALIIGIVVRLLKADSQIIPVVVPAKWRPWIAIGLGVLSGVLQAVATGTPWRGALVGGLVSGIAPIVGHELLVESLRGGKEVPVKLPPATLMLVVVGAMAGPAMGCAGSFEEGRLLGLKTASPMAKAAAADRTPDMDDYCRKLDDQRIRAGAWAKGAAVFAGVSGTGAGVVAAVDERGVPRGVVIGAGITAVAAAAVGAHQLFTAEGAGMAWARNCR